MSINSRARDALKFPDRTEEAREAVAARFRKRALDLEQNGPPVAISRLDLENDIGSLCHVWEVLKRRGMNRLGEHIQMAKEKRAALLAWRAQRQASAVRRHAIPVIKSQDKVYATLSNGQRVRVENLPEHLKAA
jgi:hypothetical protein